MIRFRMVCLSSSRLAEIERDMSSMNKLFTISTGPVQGSTSGRKFQNIQSRTR